jgi:UDP-N-acetyl-D-glucosamine/UDP-N-acetyl-D-galactosamine dehydrogenase
MNNKQQVICVVGLGYVGMPLAVAFGRTEHPTYGYDISTEKVNSLKNDIDLNNEITEEELKSTTVNYSDEPEVIGLADVVIAAVPTPIDSERNPDLTPVESASRTIGKHMKKGVTVVYESTVYPGLTEEICVPILEEESGLKFGEDFEIGYSPERINPGDKEHTLERIKKIVAGSTPETLEMLSALYGEVVLAGIHEAPSIKVAEAAKVIENVQRDLNIALVNELSLIFKKLGINTIDVLKAAETKWNFHSYRPGLVGGHCIGVDPYYLTYKAQKSGYDPQVILAGRKINDNMASWVVDYLAKELGKMDRPLESAKILMLGVTFKENVADLRNSRAKDIIKILKERGAEVFGYDPLLSKESIESNFSVPVFENVEEREVFDGMILFSPHDEIVDNVEDLIRWGKSPVAFVDVKSKVRDKLEKKEAIFYETL